MTDDTNAEISTTNAAADPRTEPAAPPIRRKRKPKGQYTRKVADEICERLAEGESLNSICRDPDMPNAKDVRRWVLDDEDGFKERHKIARSLQVDYWADEIIDAADDATNDYMERQRDDGSPVQVVNHDNIARSRLRVDARKWILSKLRPEEYGDRVKLDAKVNMPTHEERLEELRRRAGLTD